MTPEERIRAAVALRRTDRVPVVPVFDLFPARHAGMSMREFLFDPHKATEALERTYADYPFDAVHIFYGGLGPIMRRAGFAMPGDGMLGDDDIPQVVEKVLYGPEIYEDICRTGFARVLSRIMRKAREGSADDAPRAVVAGSGARYMLELFSARRHMAGKLARLGIPNITGPCVAIPALDIMSEIRSVTEFLLDLHRRPDLVLRVLTIVNRYVIEAAVLEAKLGRRKYCFIGSARSSATFISPAMFERFALPFIVELVERMVSLGVTPLLHFDSDWTPFLPYLKEYLPARRCILDPDGTTDIFRAKEVLGGHMCITGDVSASLLKLGDKDEVGDYCSRLIREVGYCGGFIMSTGCSTPVDARPENIKALMISVH